MIKNLHITNIPKDEKLFREVLEILGDDSWSDEDINNRIKNRIHSDIYYNRAMEEYVDGIYYLEDNLTKIDYKDFIKKYKPKQEENCIFKKAGFEKPNFRAEIFGQEKDRAGDLYYLVM